MIVVGCRSGDLDSGKSRRISTHDFRCCGARRVRTNLMIAAAAVISGATVLLAQEKAGQSPAITKIKLFGAKIEWKESVPDRSVVAIDLAGSDRFGDGYVPLLDAFPTLERLDLSRTAITDAGVKRLRELSALTELNLSYTDITDATLEDLRKFKSLRRLDLEGTQITEAGLRDLGKSPDPDPTQPGDRGHHHRQRIERDCETAKFGGPRPFVFVHHGRRAGGIARAQRASAAQSPWHANHRQPGSSSCGHFHT